MKRIRRLEVNSKPCIEPWGFMGFPCSPCRSLFLNLSSVLCYYYFGFSLCLQHHIIHLTEALAYPTDFLVTANGTHMGWSHFSWPHCWDPNNSWPEEPKLQGWQPHVIYRLEYHFPFFHLSIYNMYFSCVRHCCGVQGFPRVYNTCSCLRPPVHSLFTLVKCSSLSKEKLSNFYGAAQSSRRTGKRAAAFSDPPFR